MIETPPDEKILYNGYWIVLSYFPHREMKYNTVQRGWSFKIMHAGFTDANGKYDWDAHEHVTGGFYYCAWCKGHYLGEDKEKAKEKAIKIIEYVLSNTGSNYSDQGPDPGVA